MGWLDDADRDQLVEAPPELPRQRGLRGADRVDPLRPLGRGLLDALHE